MAMVTLNFLSKVVHPASVSTTKSLHQHVPFNQWRQVHTTIAIVNPRNSGNKSNDENNINNNNNKKQNISNRSTKKSSKHRKQGNASSYKFVDMARIKVVGGSGGKGCISYQSMLGSKYKKRPDGGHGGHGGNIILVADPNEQSLNMSTHHYKAEDGVNGTSREMHGRNGKDKIIKVPCGVIVKRVLEYDEVWDDEEQIIRKNPLYDIDENDNHIGENILNSFGCHKYEAEIDLFESNAENKKKSLGKNNSGNNFPHDYEDVVNTGKKSDDDGLYHWRQSHDNAAFLDMGYGIYENDDSTLASSSSDFNNTVLEREKVPIADLDKPGSYVIVAEGGRGGVGNSAYAKRQFVNNVVSKAVRKAKGIPGDEVHLELELKLIADVGLVGFPNAGKSSLLAAMSKARPEIAPYPFTTLHPLVGCVEYKDGFRALLADVPGLIDGASYGRGRGHDFLRHLERTKALMYVIDAAGVDGRTPFDDFSALIDEIQAYGNGDMMNRPAVVVANKLDLIPHEDMREDIYFSLYEIAVEKGLNLQNNGVLGISAGVTGEGLGLLSKSIRDLVGLGDLSRSQANVMAV